MIRKWNTLLIFLNCTTITIREHKLINAMQRNVSDNATVDSQSDIKQIYWNPR